MGTDYDERTGAVADKPTLPPTREEWDRLKFENAKMSDVLQNLLDFTTGDWEPEGGRDGHDLINLGIVPAQKALGEKDESEPWSTERTEMAKKATVERDQLKETVIKLVAACQSLMRELASEGATDWGVVNEALMEGEVVVSRARKASALVSE